MIFLYWSFACSDAIPPPVRIPFPESHPCCRGLGPRLRRNTGVAPHVGHYRNSKSLTVNRLPPRWPSEPGTYTASLRTEVGRQWRQQRPPAGSMNRCAAPSRRLGCALGGMRMLCGQKSLTRMMISLVTSQGIGLGGSLDGGCGHWWQCRNGGGGGTTSRLSTQPGIRRTGPVDIEGSANRGSGSACNSQSWVRHRG